MRSQPVSEWALRPESFVDPGADEIVAVHRSQ